MNIVTCFLVIILIVSLIGPSNIFKILIIGIPIAVIIMFLLKKLGEKWDFDNFKKEREYYQQCSHNKTYFEEGYSERPHITGDYFDWLYDYRAGNILYCRYGNTSNCANCSRRKEYKIGEKFYYGISNNCGRYNYLDE